MQEAVDAHCNERHAHSEGNLERHGEHVQLIERLEWIAENAGGVVRDGYNAQPACGESATMLDG